MGKRVDNLQAVVPQRRNANRHTQRGMGELETSIRERGWIGAITAAANGETFDGSARREVLAAIDLEDAIIIRGDGSKPVVYIREDIPDADDPRAKLLALEANKIAADNLDWDPAVIVALGEEGVDLSGLFRDDEMATLLEGLEESVDEGADDAPPVIDEDKPTRVQPGEVWQVGEHIIACLDSTDRGNIQKWAKGATFVVADPPYGVKAVGKDGRIGSDYSDNKTPGYERFKGYSANVYAPVIGDETTDTAVDAALLILDLYPKVMQVWWGANHYAQALPPSPCWVVWDKENDGDDFPDAELAWTSHKGAVRIFRHMWKGMLRASEVNEKRVHPTQKPRSLMRWLFERYGKVGDVVLDPFLGSGPTIKAAHEPGDRRVIGFDLSPHYCDHVLEWCEMQGLTAERIESAT